MARNPTPAPASKEAPFIEEAARSAYNIVVTELPYQVNKKTLQERIAEIDAEITKRNALRQHLVSHIEWFRAREQRPAVKPGFPRAPTRGGKVPIPPAHKGASHDPGNPVE